jgi:uncharacterized protein (TIGR00297 family)
MMGRALLGAIAAALITALARRLGTLDERGQWAAMACGVLAAAAGWPWALLLVAYFVTASAVTRLGAGRKAERTLRSVPQVRARDASQVFANGGLFAVLALQAGTAPESIWGAAAVGALAAASSDTWATETGTLWGGRPRSIVHWRHTAPGLSGGITAVGSLGAVVGAVLVALIAATAHRLPWSGPFVRAAAVGGIVGCIVDSLVGGTVQSRRWCAHCKEYTERRVHPCSYRTVHVAGYRWITNDIVNTAATFAGAAAAVAARELIR